MADYQLFIDGEYVDAQSGETFTTYDPATGQAIGEIAKAGREDSVRAIYADVPEVLHPVARFSVWAHLRKLRDDGPVRASDADDPDAVWAAG